MFVSTSLFIFNVILPDVKLNFKRFLKIVFIFGLALKLKNMKTILTFLFALIIVSNNLSAKTYSLNISTKVSNTIKAGFKEDGRIFLFVSTSQHSEPRFNTWPNKSNMIFATNIKNWNGEKFVFNNQISLTKSVEVSLDKIPEGNYKIQVLWDQDVSESGINASGNFYSEVISVELNENKSVELPLTQIAEPQKLVENEFLMEIDYKSDILTRWWGKEMRIKAAVLLPGGYFKNPNKRYPVRYNVAGYGGRYTRANRYAGNENFMEWWEKDDSPQILTVFLDGEGPFGDCYQLNSENSGPYGTALTEELIPYIEKKFRGIGTPENRFVEGCSTGGWVSLALQLFYPDFFNGCFSYSPDQVDFENCQLINIYKDENAFYNEYDYLRPIVREVSGEPIISQKDFIQFENVLGRSDTYVTSGGQFSAFTALFSPKGDDGLPKPMFDSQTGKIDREVAEYWRKHDLKDYVEKNWETLGPKIQGKLWIWGADMDNFYLNYALRKFDEMLQTVDNPKSDAIITFSPMKGHCAEYDFKKVHLQIEEKLEAAN